MYKCHEKLKIENTTSIDKYDLHLMCWCLLSLGLFLNQVIVFYIVSGYKCYIVIPNNQYLVLRLSNMRLSYIRFNSQINLVCETLDITSFNYFQDKLRGVFLLSTVTEWLLALSIMAFVITFVSCFKELRVITIDVQLKEDHNRYRDQENGQVILTKFIM